MKSIGNWLVFALILLNPLLWWLFPPQASPFLSFGDPDQRIRAELLATTAMALMTVSLVLALRLKFLEPLFGGLDKMYATHKTCAFLAIVLLFAHQFTVLPQKSSEQARMLGIASIAGISLLILLTVAPRLPLPFLQNHFPLKYHIWRYTHKTIGLFFILGNLHATMVNTVLIDAPIPGWYWKIATNIGIAAYVYRELVQPWLQRKHAFTVQAANKLNASTLELVLAPARGKPRQMAGQFAFIRFPGDGAFAEAHPFTISSAPGEPNMRFSIKACGDWTKALMARAAPGMQVQVEGCHGRLNYKTGGARQIWVAGGIGVTPFLCWARDFGDTLDRDIHFFYTVRAAGDALFWDEFEAAARRLPRFKPVLNVSSTAGSLTADGIERAVGNVKDCDVYLCGPLPMTQALSARFRWLGVPAGRIHFEEFNFR